MTQINNTEHERNRGLEVLLYKREDKIQRTEDSSSRNFNLKTIFSLFNRELHFQVDIELKPKNNSRERKQC